MKYLDDLERSQIPFATSKAMNRTMVQAQQAVRREAYARAFTQRNKALPKALTTIPRGHWATKKKLKVTMMNVRDGRTGRMAGEGFVERQITGSMKTPRGSKIAVPVTGPGLRRGKAGAIPKGKRPRNNKKLFKLGNRLVERQRRKLVTRFALTSSAKPSSRGRFRYYETARATVNRRLQVNWNRDMIVAVRKTRQKYS